MRVRQKILFVDNDAAPTASLAHKLRRTCVITVADGPLRALEAVAEQGPYAAVVASLRQPGLSGTELFVRLKQTCPDTLRILLCASADLQVAMDAVNAGGVFRLLPQPCPGEELEEALAAGVAQYLQVTREKAFLKGALRGIIKVLTDLLALLNPEATGRSARVKRLVTDMARYCDAPDVWRIELAVVLSQLGGMVMPEAMFATLRGKGTLDGACAELFARHPAIGADLLENIPKLDEVAEIIRHQETPFVGNGHGGPAGGDIPLGARLLKAALDYDRLLTSGTAREEALAIMARRKGLYDPKALQLLGMLAGSCEGYRKEEAVVTALAVGMVLEEDIRLASGEKAAVAGQVVDPGLLERLRHLDTGAQQPVQVLVPANAGPSVEMADPELLALLRRVRDALPGV
jgi:response regulator RpfG family c-di-GMP phosphodiesterase